MSISDLLEKIKHSSMDTVHNLLVSVIIIGVAFSAFALGRFSVKRVGSEVQFVYPEEVVKRAEMSLVEAQIVVASSRGSKYYYPWCSGAISMSEANKIEFGSTELAREAGYTPASNCDGLN